MTELAVGLEGEAERTVTAEDTAEHFSSGTVPVFATPALLAMMEEAAVNAVQRFLDEGSTTVGTWAELEHLAASKIGANVRAIAQLLSADGRVLEFACEAYEDDKLIGRGRHRRAIVDTERFLAKL